FTATTATARPRVSFSAATASGFETAVQKWCSPPARASQTSAARGIRTTTLRYASASPPVVIGEPRARRRALGRRAAGATSGAPQPALDLRHHPVVGVEELLGDLVPAADVGDLEQLRSRRELLHVLLSDARDDGPVARRCEQLLGGRREEVVVERLRL